ncbi:TIGR04104 family putative zinc finger protein [Paenisporosarcina sp.]|uniref:TIGR04104 family putative zinc finger protein n=1 Tax=Paenisporosarcina sp. TaxID=1932001 RepID=UPI003C71EC9C
MGLQTCDNCGNQFKWSQIYKSFMIFYKPIRCSECDTKHHVSFSSRIIASLLTFLPLGIYGTTTIYQSISYSFLIALLLVSLGLIISPFFMRYRSA